MIIFTERMDVNHPKEFGEPQLFDDPQLLDDRLEVWTLIIQKFTVIPPSPMVLLKKDNQSIVFNGLSLLVVHFLPSNSK